MHTHTLLIADDSIPIQRVIQLTFASGPIRVVVAADGQQALDLIAADRPDIVLASTSLPGVDGYAIARQMSKQRRVRKLPVWLLTSRFEANDEAKIKESGAKGILEKPLESGVVLARVKHALGLQEVQEPVGERASDPPKPARPKPARRRRAASAAPLVSQPAPEQSMGGALTPEVLAQIAGTAAAHAIAAYERARGAAPAPSMPPPGLKAASASPRLPQDPWTMPPHQSESVDLLQLQREMGFDEFAFDLVPAVQPAGSVNNREPARRMDLDQAADRGPAKAHADIPEASTYWDSNLAGWLSTEMRDDHVTRTGPPGRTITPAPGAADPSGDARRRVRTRRTGFVDRADLVLEPLRLAVHGLAAWTTRLRAVVRGAEGQARANLGGVADRCRSVFAAMI